LHRDIALYWKPGVVTTILGHSGELTVTIEPSLPSLQVNLPPRQQVNGRWAWTIKFAGVPAPARRRMVSVP
jgi:hypothetical protein